MDVQSPTLIRPHRGQLCLPDPGRYRRGQGGEPLGGPVAVGVVEHGGAAGQGLVEGGRQAGQEQVADPAQGQPELDGDADPLWP